MREKREGGRGGGVTWTLADKQQKPGGELVGTAGERNIGREEREGIDRQKPPGATKGRNFLSSLGFSKTQN